MKRALADNAEVKSELPPGPLIKLSFDKDGKLQLPENYYNQTENSFWVRNTLGEFSRFTEREFRKMLRGALALKKLNLV